MIFGDLIPYLRGRGARKAKRRARELARAELRLVEVGGKSYWVRPYKGKRRKR